MLCPLFTLVEVFAVTLMDWTEEIRAPWVNLLTGIGMEWRIDYIESPVQTCAE